MLENKDIILGEYYGDCLMNDWTDDILDEFSSSGNNLELKEELLEYNIYINPTFKQFQKENINYFGLEENTYLNQLLRTFIKSSKERCFEKFINTDKSKLFYKVMKVICEDNCDTLYYPYSFLELSKLYPIEHDSENFEDYSCFIELSDDLTAEELYSIEKGNDSDCLVIYDSDYGNYRVFSPFSSYDLYEQYCFESLTEDGLQDYFNYAFRRCPEEIIDVIDSVN